MQRFQQFLCTLVQGVREGLAGGTARALKNMLIFPNCSGKKCPIQKFLIQLETCLVVPPAAQNWTPRSKKVKKR